jgi:hypothetical protein
MAWMGVDAGGRVFCKPWNLLRKNRANAIEYRCRPERLIRLGANRPRGGVRRSRKRHPALSDAAER